MGFLLCRLISDGYRLLVDVKVGFMVDFSRCEAYQVRYIKILKRQTRVRKSGCCFWKYEGDNSLLEGTSWLCVREKGGGGKREKRGVNEGNTFCVRRAKQNKVSPRPLK